MKKIVQKLDIVNNTTADGKPDGGFIECSVPDVDGSCSVLEICWQKGPLILPDGTELPPNGVFLETVVRACIARLEYYQSTEFKCRENAIALTHLETALLWLGKRAADREERGVLGTHKA